MAALSTFPFCVCSDYKCADSPYRLVDSGISPVGTDYTDICFVIEDVSRLHACMHDDTSQKMKMFWLVDSMQQS